jgi:ABC-type uncharacterized transport system fused permease/ATPase subunit
MSLTPKDGSDDLSYSVFQASFWRRFWILAKPFWKRPLCRRDGSLGAWMLLLLLIIQIFLTTWLLVKLNYQQGEFFTALSKKEESRFWDAVASYGFIIVIAVPILAAKEYTLSRLSILWRAWMSEYLMTLYMCNKKAYFRLSADHRTSSSTPGAETCDYIDNPDQRIVSDVDSFTKAALNFIVVFLGAGLRIFSFGAILYSISVILLLLPSNPTD